MRTHWSCLQMRLCNQSERALHTDSLRAIHIDRERGIFVTGSDQASLKVHCLATGEVLQTACLGCDSMVWSIAGCGNLLFVGISSTVVRMCDVRDVATVLRSI